MKNIVIIVALILGLIVGWLARGVRQSPKPQTQTAADTAEMAKLYPAVLALAALKDMRVLVSLSSNDVAMAKRLLLQDLKGHASSLSGLGQEYSLSDFDRKAGKDAEDFLRDFRQ
jgi:hypothetical protein